MLFITSSFFKMNAFSFDFMLWDEKVLIKGKLQKSIQEYVSASMQFAVGTPAGDLGHNPCLTTDN